jgi:hypothetical protein
MELMIAAEGAAPIRVRLDGRSRKEISLGSAATCDLVLTGRNIAGHHAQIMIERGGAWLCALEPLLLNGQQVSGWSPLEGVGSLELGSARLQVSARPGEAGAAGPEEYRAPCPPTTSAQRRGLQDSWSSPDVAADQYARLAALFALPPEEVGAVASGPATPFLKQKFLSVSAGVWVLLSSCLVVALVGSTTRRLPLARATPTAEVRPAGPTVAPLDPARSSPVRGRRPSPGEIRAAAEALFARDDARALDLYRELARKDERFRSFAHALELRSRKR